MERIRYSKGESGRKNTLVTLRDGNIIWFGISRCNLGAKDRFDKQMGMKIARGRCLKAQAEGADFIKNTGTHEFLVHESGLRGHVALENIVGLLEYFDDVDSHFSH